MGHYSGSESPGAQTTSECRLLQGGSLVLMADYGQGIRNYDRFTVRPRTGRLDDDRWHDVRIVRRGRQVSAPA